MSDVDPVSNVDETMDGIIRSKLNPFVEIEEINLNDLKVHFNEKELTDSENVASDYINHKSKSHNDSHQLTDIATISKDKDLTQPIRCYVNKDNTISFINNANSSPEKKGEVYYACWTSASNASQDDQILQLIPQNKLSNYMDANKVFSAVQFLNAPPKLENNQFFNNDLSDDQCALSNATKQNCAVCNKDFPSKRSYLKHMTIHDNDREFKCRWCKVSYNYDVNLLVHIAIIHPNQCTIDNDADMNYRCLVCLLKFSRKKTLQGHCLIHQMDEDLYCDQCPASFNSRILLEKHVNSHAEETNTSSKISLNCRLCEMICENVGHMKRHYKQFHQDTLPSPEIPEKVNQSDSESDQNYDPSRKQRRTSKIATNIIRRYAQDRQRTRNKSIESTSDVRTRGRPKKVDNDVKNDKSLTIKKKTTEEISKGKQSAKVTTQSVNQTSKKTTKDSIIEVNKGRLSKKMLDALTHKTPAKVANEIISEVRNRRLSQKMMEYEMSKHIKKEMVEVPLTRAISKKTDDTKNDLKLKKVTKETHVETPKRNLSKKTEDTSNDEKSKKVTKETPGEALKRRLSKKVDTKANAETSKTTRKDAPVDTQKRRLSRKSDDSANEALTKKVTKETEEEAQNRRLTKKNDETEDTMAKKITKETSIEIVERRLSKKSNDTDNEETPNNVAKENSRESRIRRLSKRLEEALNSEVAQDEISEVDEDVQIVAEVDESTLNQEKSQDIPTAETSEVKKRGRPKKVDTSFEVEEDTLEVIEEIFMENPRHLLKRKMDSSLDIDMVDESFAGIKKRGRPRKSEDPSISIKEKSQEIKSEYTGEVKKRGRPKGSLNNGSMMEYRCDMCYRMFKTAILLRRHEVTHTGYKEFACPTCNKRFTQKSSVKIHMITHKEVKSHKCAYCFKAFTYQHNMFTHMKNVHKYNSVGGSERMKAGIPGRRPSGFATSTPLVNRVVRITNGQEPLDNSVLSEIKEVVKKRRRCRLCKAAKKWNCGLCRHVQTKAPLLKPYKCQLCYKSFQVEAVLDSHHLAHSKNKTMYECDQCDKYFSLHKTLITHKRMHSGKPMRYRCNRCPSKFRDPSKYRSHFKKAHPTPPIPEVVIQEDRDELIELDSGTGTIAKPSTIKRPPRPPIAMPTKTYILQERSNPKAYRPFRCNQCDKSYKLRRYLRDHLKDHKSYSDRKPCDYCEKTFLTVRSLQQHTRTMHVKRRIFACSLCPATFILKASLLRHGVVHTDLKPYACPMCLRTFKTQLYCDRHINQQKCNRVHIEGQSVVPGIEGVPDGTKGTGEQYCNYRLVDADLSAAQTQNMLMTSFVNEVSGDKFMVLNDGQTGAASGGLNWPSAGVPVQDISTLDQENMYYQGQRPHAGPSGVSTLLNKYPLLKATLFDEADVVETSNIGWPIDHDQDNSQVMADIDRVTNVIAGQRLYHGCANCPMTFSDSEKLIRHVRQNHTAAKQFTCSLCNKSFGVELSLWAHTKIHEGRLEPGTDIECIECKQRFRSVPSLSRHVRMQHNDTLNYYKCTHCDNTYKTTRELDSHIKVVNSDYDALIIDANMVVSDDTGTESYRRLPKEIKNPNIRRKDFLFELKDSEIDQIASLDMGKATKLSMQELIKAARQKKAKQSEADDPSTSRRNRVDDESALFHCEECFKGFNRASNLQQHMSVHTKSAPYECAKCHRRFRHRCSLKTHEQTKHNALMKLLRCHLCQKLLRSQVALGNHMKMHLKVYPTKCDKCSVMLDSYDQEKRHRKLNHPLKGFVSSDSVMVEEEVTVGEEERGVVLVEMDNDDEHGVVLEEVGNEEEPLPVSGEEPMAEEMDESPPVIMVPKISPRFKAAMAADNYRDYGKGPGPKEVTKAKEQSRFKAMMAARAKQAEAAKAKEEAAKAKEEAARAKEEMIARAKEDMIARAKEAMLAIKAKEAASKAKEAAVPPVAPVAPSKPKEGSLPSVPVVVSVIKCVVCNVRFQSISEYESHHCRKEQWKVHQCIICDETFGSSTDLAAHTCRLSKQQMNHFSCSLCNLLFINRSLLITHQRTVHRL